MKHQINLTPDMIIKKEHVDDKRKRDGSLEPVYEFKLNTDFWQGVPKPIDVIIDEAHTIINSRRAMSKINIIVTDWLALMRRILGERDNTGNLVFITQLPNRIDIIAREMCNHVRYHICHYIKTCRRCGLRWQEHSDIPEALELCPECGNWKLNITDHTIEVWKFKKMEDYMFWKEMGSKMYYSHYYMRDTTRYFPLYDTLQWDNLFSEFY